MKRFIFVLPIVLLLAGCTSLFRSVVTLRDVVDVAMQDWSDASAKGQTTQEIDRNVRSAYSRAQQAAGVAADALTAYKNGGSQDAYLNALSAARAAVSSLIDVIIPLITPQKASDLITLQKKASSP